MGIHRCSIIESYNIALRDDDWEIKDDNSFVRNKIEEFIEKLSEVFDEDYDLKNIENEDDEIRFDMKISHYYENRHGLDIDNLCDSILSQNTESIFSEISNIAENVYVYANELEVREIF